MFDMFGSYLVVALKFQAKIFQSGGRESGSGDEVEFIHNNPDRETSETKRRDEKRREGERVGKREEKETFNANDE